MLLTVKRGIKAHALLVQSAQPVWIFREKNSHSYKTCQTSNAEREWVFNSLDIRVRQAN